MKIFTFSSLDVEWYRIVREPFLNRFSAIGDNVWGNCGTSVMH